MELQTKSIIKLHKIDKRLNQIHDEKGDLPSIINEQEETLQTLRESVSSCDTEKKNFEKEKNAGQIEIDELLVLLDKHNAQIFEVKNNKEYDAILKEIDHIQEKHNNFKLTMKEINENLENLSSEIVDLKEKIGKIETRLVDYNEQLEIMNEQTKSEEKKLNDDKSNIIKDISDVDFLSKYDEGSITVSSVSRRCCNNCFSNLPDQMYLDIKKGTKLHNCPDCATMLYYDQDEEE